MGKSKLYHMVQHKRSDHLLLFQKNEKTMHGNGGKKINRRLGPKNQTTISIGSQ